MVDQFKALREALADLPKLRKWFVVGPPWGKGDFIVSGHPDPHMGKYVADTEDFDGEGENDLEHAALIVEAVNAAAALLAEVDALRKKAARYDWLRAKVYIDPTAKILRISDTYLSSVETLPEALDAAIDEAITRAAASMDGEA